jgi:hypothetical protein
MRNGRKVGIERKEKNKLKFYMKIEQQKSEHKGEGIIRESERNDTNSAQCMLLC